MGAHQCGPRAHAAGAALPWLRPPIARLYVKMTEASGGDLVEALVLIRDRARFGLQSDAEGARNALIQIGKLCDQALTTKTEPDSGGSQRPTNR